MLRVTPKYGYPSPHSQRRISEYHLASEQWKITWRTLDAHVLSRQSFSQNTIDISSASRAYCRVASAAIRAESHTPNPRVVEGTKSGCSRHIGSLKINEPFLPFHWKSFRRARARARNDADNVAIFTNARMSFLSRGGVLVSTFVFPPAGDETRI